MTFVTNFSFLALYLCIKIISMNTKIFIQNLKCNGCASTITKKLSHLENITDIKVAVEESSVTFN